MHQGYCTGGSDCESCFHARCRKAKLIHKRFWLHSRAQWSGEITPSASDDLRAQARIYTEMLVDESAVVLGNDFIHLHCDDDEVFTCVGLFYFLSQKRYAVIAMNEKRGIVQVDPKHVVPLFPPTMPIADADMVVIQAVMKTVLARVARGERIPCMSTASPAYAWVRPDAESHYATLRTVRQR